MRGFIATVIAISTLSMLAIADDKKNEKSANSPPTKVGRGKFTISEETTYVTKPLDKDGYPDYVTALNEKLREGVTPENNANVLLWKALGPHADHRTMPAAYFEWLGIEPPPEKGDYFVSFADFLKQKSEKTDDANRKIFDRVYSRPWVAKDFPLIAEWVAKNQLPIDLIIRASKRDRYFCPFVPSSPETGLLRALMPIVNASYGLRSALRVRAMLRISEEKYEEALQDLLACHRLGRLLARGGAHEYVIGLRLDDSTFSADVALLEWCQADAKLIESLERGLQSLPELPTVATAVDLSERMIALEAVMFADRYGVKYFSNKIVKGHGVTEEVLHGINWDPALRSINKWHDRYVAALRITDRTERKKKLTEIYKEHWMEKTRIAIADNETRFQKGKPDENGKACGELLIWELLSYYHVFQDYWDRNQQRQTNLSVALALARFRLDHGDFPRELKELQPKYLSNMPMDFFSGKPLIYERSEKGYLLYSVGINGIDDGGKTISDDVNCDDLVIRMPAGR